jgi:hypothetical protein
MTAATALQSALSLISSPHSWAQKSVALDSRGNEVKPLADTAKRFCMIGALQRVPCSSDEYGEAVLHLRRSCGKLSIFEFNDQCGHKAMVKVMKRAIAASGGRA